MGNFNISFKKISKRAGQNVLFTFRVKKKIICILALFVALFHPFLAYYVLAVSTIAINHKNKKGTTTYILHKYNLINVVKNMENQMIF